MPMLAEVINTFPDALRARRLVEAIYRDIGMAAVADALALEAEALDPVELQSIQRGARYAHLMPGRPAQRKAP